MEAQKAGSFVTCLLQYLLFGHVINNFDVHERHHGEYETAKQAGAFSDSTPSLSSSPPDLLVSQKRVWVQTDQTLSMYNSPQLILIGSYGLNQPSQVEQPRPATRQLQELYYPDHPDPCLQFRCMLTFMLLPGLHD